MKRNLFLGNKKAQMNGLVPLVTTLIVIGLLLGVGFLVLDDFKETVNNDAATVTNEVITYPTTTAGTIPAKNATTVDCFNTFVGTSLINESSDINYGPIGTNWTYDGTTGAITNLTTYSTGLTSSVNVSYTYLYGTDSCTAIELTEEATATIPTWLTIIVILFIVGILLTIVFRVLPIGGKGSSGTVAEI